MDIKMPAVVYLLMKNIAALSGFEFVSPDDILPYLFVEGFTETKPVNSGWVAMQNDSRVAIANAATILLLFCLLGILLVLYMVLSIFELCCKFIVKVREKMHRQIFWNLILIVGLESYLDSAVFAMANLEEIYVNTFDDALNLIFVTFLICYILVLPIATICILRDHRNRL